MYICVVPQTHEGDTNKNNNNVFTSGCSRKVIRTRITPRGMVELSIQACFLVEGTFAARGAFVTDEEGTEGTEQQQHSCHNTLTLHAAVVPVVA